MTNFSDRELASQAWDQVTQEINGAEDELKTLREPFIEVMITGNVMRKLEKQAAETLGNVPWIWPWFEKWEAKFTQWDAFPYSWPDLLPDEDEIEEWSPEEMAVLRRQEMAPLILHTAEKIFYASKHMLPYKTGDMRMPESWRLVQMDDPTENRIAATYEANIAAGDLSVVPPFFPGDRTTLQPVLRRY